MSHFSIAYCADRGVANALAVSMHSVLKNLRPGCAPRFYLTLEGYSEADIAELKRKLDALQRPYEIVLLDCELEQFENLKSLHGNRMTYARLMLPAIIDEAQFLYLDADTLAVGDLSKIIDYADPQYSGAVVANGSVEYSVDRALLTRLGRQLSDPYFNAGVLLVNTPAWQENQVTERCLELGAQHPHELHSADQALLNHVLHGDFSNLPETYNQLVYSWSRPADFLPGGLLHFNGSPKPWDLLGGAFHQMSAHWHEHARQCLTASELRAKYFHFPNYPRAARLAKSYLRALRRRRGG